MEAKHTPGPWVADGGRSILGDPKAYIGDPADKYTSVATIEMLGDVDTMRANARLIAAAPDLLAALEAALTVADTLDLAADHCPYCGAGDTHADDCKYIMWTDAARAAIARATGEQS